MGPLKRGAIARHALFRYDAVAISVNCFAGWSTISGEYPGRELGMSSTR